MHDKILNRALCDGVMLPHLFTAARHKSYDDAATKAISERITIAVAELGAVLRGLFKPEDVAPGPPGRFASKFWSADNRSFALSGA
jgi:hypothetical protein